MAEPTDPTSARPEIAAMTTQPARLAALLDRTAEAVIVAELPPDPCTPDANAVLISAMGVSEETIGLARRIVDAQHDHDPAGCRYCSPEGSTKHPPGDPKPPPPPPPPPTNPPKGTVGDGDVIVDDTRAIASLDLLVEHVERTVDLLTKHIDGMEIAERSRLYFPLDVLTVGAEELRRHLGQLEMAAAVASGEAARCDDCGDVVNHADLDVHRARMHDADR